ncbi:MAG: putative Ig domain-containing protein [Rikenellaceae bacterium]
MKKTLFLPLLAFAATLVGCGESAPKVYDPATGEGYYILTPKVSDAPRINGAEIFGVRPGSPFFHTITATGARPMTFKAENLPAGLSMDAKGTITGKIADLTPRSYIVKLTASNANGSATEDFEIKVGEDITLTPPMGWSSWIAMKKTITQQKVLDNAKMVVELGLNDYGYSYVNIDDCWQGRRGGEFNGIQANLEVFPDIKELSDQIHGMGFKFGIYSTPWITSYAKYVGGSSNKKDGYWDESMIIDAKTVNIEGTASKYGKYYFDENDAKQWAAWNIDYMKYDWNPNDSTSILRMSKALRNSGRDIAFSVSNSCPMYLGDLCSDHVEVFRTNGDIRARWDKDREHINLVDNWNHHNKWLEEGFEGGPGHTPDADFLMVGLQMYGADDSLTVDELYHHVSSYILWGTPLLLSFDLSTMQPFEKSLVTNVELIDINQDKLSKPGRLKYVNGDIQVLVKELANGDKAFGIFNFGEKQTATVDFSSLGLSGKQLLRDAWRHEDIGTYSECFSAVVPRHGAIVVRAKAVK